MNAKDFSNARFVRNLFERIWEKAALRCQMSQIECTALTVEDFALATSDKEFHSIMEQKKQNVYETICKMFDDKNLRYEKHEDDLVITCTVRGDDLPMDILFVVRDDRQIVQLISPMTFTVPEDKRIDMALATTVINDMLVDGSFDFDMAKGRVAFRLTASYIESILGKELFEYLLMVSASNVDEYNDKFLMLAKGMISFEQFLENESK